jgi:NAD(P)-dependent dehydrogenase (short-subunit alcohol dehydrogenase family)
MNPKPLEGKVALVTGSYRKLGAVTAETFARNGASIVVSDLESPELAHLGQALIERISSHGVESMAIAADLSYSVGVKRLCGEALDHFDHVDILVNNCGPAAWGPYLGLSEAAWDNTMNVNLKAAYLMTQMLAPSMKANGWGRIINMSAGSAFVRSHGVYGLAKSGVVVLTEALALELGPEITVNAIAPGQILESLPEIAKVDPAFGDRYRSRAPAKRLVTRAEVAAVITQICTPVFDMMTGMTIRLDGGAEIPRF